MHQATHLYFQYVTTTTQQKVLFLQKEQASETLYLYKQTEQHTLLYVEYCNLAERLSHNSSMNRLVYLK